MKRYILIVFALFTLIYMTGCTGSPKPLPSATETAVPSVSETQPPPSAAATPSPSVSLTPSPMPSVPTAPVSFTTGLPSTKPYKPVGVMIENAPGARPQTGLQSADIVYEALAEGDITRFFCVYNDNMPTNLGPVRSLRVYYMNIQQEWDCILVHFGGSSASGANVYGKSSRYIKIRVDGLHGYAAYFWRIKNRQAPHNVYTNLVKVQKLYDYTPNKRNPWHFNTQTAYKPDEAFVKTVYLPFAASKTYVSYQYDPAKDIFVRYMGKKAFIDAATKKPVTVKNIIVQYVRQNSIKDKKGRRLLSMTGSGKAEFFIGGKHIPGTWERKSLSSQTVFKDASGAEIILQPGNTWIEVHPETKEVQVDYVKS